MNNFIILQGANRTPYHYWYGWLFNKIYEKNKEVKIINFPTQNNLNYKNWEIIFSAYHKVNVINENSIIIAHSTAVIFAVRYIVKHHLKIKKLFLISGFNTLDFIKSEDEEINKIILKSNQSFVNKKIKLCKINKYVDEITCFISNNDPIIPKRELEKFANSFNAKVIQIKNAGHFNDLSGYTEFPKLFNALKKDL